MRPDRPFLIVHIQIGNDLGQFHVGFPIGIDGSHITPIRHIVIPHADTALLKTLRKHAIFFNHVRDQILAEIVAGMRIIRIANQLFDTGNWLLNT